LAPFAPVFAGLVYLMMASVAGVVHAVFLFFAALSIAAQPRGPRYASIAASAGFLVALLVGLFIGMGADRRLVGERLQSPPVSLAGRLAYEERINRKTSGKSALTPVPSSATSMWSVLDGTIARRYLMSPRATLLSQLHRATAERFVRAPGFGISRMPAIRWDELPELDDIELEPSGGSRSRLKLSDLVMYFAPPDEKIVRGLPPLLQLHYLGYLDFLDPYYYGGRGRRAKEFVGFVEHAFHTTVNEEPAGAGIWPVVVKRLELVSLWRFETPRVYRLGHLPRMDQLRHDRVRTRPLDGFESKALGQLAKGRDVIISTRGPTIRMLGALRAVTTCLECHDVDRGDLLGAFSYELVPSGAAAPGERTARGAGESKGQD